MENRSIREGTCYAGCIWAVISWPRPLPEVAIAGVNYIDNDDDGLLNLGSVAFEGAGNYPNVFVPSLKQRNALPSLQW